MIGLCVTSYIGTFATHPHCRKIENSIDQHSITPCDYRIRFLVEHERLFQKKEEEFKGPTLFISGPGWTTLRIPKPAFALQRSVQLWKKVLT